MVHDSIHICPGFELPLPVAQCGKGYYHEEWTFDAVCVDLIQERDALDGFSQPHLISKDTILSARASLDEKYHNQRQPMGGSNRKESITSSTCTMTKY